MAPRRRNRPPTIVRTPEELAMIARYGRVLRPRNRHEVSDFLDMIEQQGAEAEERGLAILGEYEKDAARRELDAGASGDVDLDRNARFTPSAPLAGPHKLKGRGHSLRAWIADRTKAVLGDQDD